jgi:hypothetical protein
MCYHYTEAEDGRKEEGGIVRERRWRILEGVRGVGGSGGVEEEGVKNEEWGMGELE